ncbi:hypothetical protein DRN84_01385 [Candidatus Geothermarchaeota archaeon]|nr:MAG: hypothetical protein DRN84_01385 [Candidatus Geothermarchaeota archaeon]
MFGTLLADYKHIEFTVYDENDSIITRFRRELRDYRELGDIINNILNDIEEDRYKIRYLGIASEPSIIFKWSSNDIKVYGRDILTETSGKPGLLHRFSKYKYTFNSWIPGNIISHIKGSPGYMVGNINMYVINYASDNHIIDASTATSFGLYDPLDLKEINSVFKRLDIKWFNPMIYDNIAKFGYLGNTEIVVSTTISSARIMGVGCLRKGCTLIHVDEYPHVTRVIDELIYPSRGSIPLIILKVGDYVKYGLEISSFEKISSPASDHITYKDVSHSKTDSDLEDAWIDIMGFKIYTLLDSVMRDFEHPPDLIYFTSSGEVCDRLIQRIADYSGYIVAELHDTASIGLLRLIKMATLSYRFDDIYEVENARHLYHPSIKENERIKLISELGKRIDKHF